MKKIFILPILSLFFAPAVYPQPFKIVGSRALGMGGASVAVVGDTTGSESNALATHWNPAALGRHKNTDVRVPIDLGVELTGNILSYIEDISDMVDRYDAIISAQETGDAITLEQIDFLADALGKLNELTEAGIGVQVDANSGFNMAVGNFGFSSNVLLDISLDPNIDLSHLYLGAIGPNPGVDLSQIPNIALLTGEPADASQSTASDQLEATITTLVNSGGVSLGAYTVSEISNALVNYADSQGYSTGEITDTVNSIVAVQPLLDSLLSAGGADFTDNDSSITLNGVMVIEAVFGYGHDLGFLGEAFSHLYLGGNVKYMQGRVGYLKRRIWEEDITTLGDLYDDFYNNIETSHTVGVDAGLLYECQCKFKPRIGVVGKNLNIPSFSQPQIAIDDGLAGDYEVDPQARVGIALYPVDWLLVAADYDLTKNSTGIDEYDSQYVNLGAEINVINKPAFNVALRAGVRQNIAHTDSDLVFTGGLGINALHFVFEISGGAAIDTVEIEDASDLPSSVHINISMGVNF